MSLTRSTRSPTILKANAEGPFPLPPGEGLCNNLQAYLTKVIHTLSTPSLVTVEKFTFLACWLAHLSTKTVDILPILWITFRGCAGMVTFYTDSAIQSVDKPVDNRGRSCG